MKNKMITTDDTDTTDKEWFTPAHTHLLIRVISAIRG